MNNDELKRVSEELRKMAQQHDIKAIMAKAPIEGRVPRLRARDLMESDAAREFDKMIVLYKERS